MKKDVIAKINILDSNREPKITFGIDGIVIVNEQNSKSYLHKKGER